MPLLLIIGNTTTTILFFISFNFMQDKINVDKMGAIEQVRNILGNGNAPWMIVIGKELALMEAIEKVFRNIVTNLLCAWQKLRGG